MNLNKKLQHSLSGSYETIKNLLEERADPNYQNEDSGNKNSLHIYLSFRKLEMRVVELLIER